MVCFVFVCDVFICVSGPWEYSEAAKQAVSDYMQAFPALFNALKLNESGPVLNIKEAYPDENEEEQLDSMCSVCIKLFYSS